MKMTAVGTIEAAEYGNLVRVELHTDAGLDSLGETFPVSGGDVRLRHEACAPHFLRPLRSERHARALMNEVAVRGARLSGGGSAGSPETGARRVGSSAARAASDQTGSPLRDPVRMKLL